MARVPPGLLYLTVYNPTLRPIGPITPGDEDAEEQAHILFYTSRERAVSRDRMLRQVGLAKALVNFSEMFNASDQCNNIHSQSRRMIMVSPEPDYWIHAAVEVAKTPRPAIGKTKAKQKGKQKESQPVVYDYHDGSVHDLALRGYIQQGYHQFKLTHGSFSSILNTLGQEALELQLERFFTVWAWSWNLEDGHEFSEHLGIPLHPLYHSLVPLIDDFTSHIPSVAAALIVIPPHFVPSAEFVAAQYPTSFARHVASLIPLPRDVSPQPTVSEMTIKPSKEGEGVHSPQNSSGGKSGPPKVGSHEKSNGSTFLGIPPMNINMNVTMDVRKWTWPFGNKHPEKRSPEGLPVDSLDEKKDGERHGEREGRSGEGREEHLEERTDSDQAEPNTEVDTSSLLDAIESDVHISRNASDAPSPSSTRSISPSAVETSILPEDTAVRFPRMHTPDALANEHALSSGSMSPTSVDDSKEVVSGEEGSVDANGGLSEGAKFKSLDVLIPSGVLGTETSSPTATYLVDPQPTLSPACSPMPVPEFSSIVVHLADGGAAFETRRRKVLYFLNEGMIIAFLERETEAVQPHDLHSAAEDAMQLLKNTRSIIEGEEIKSASDTSLSATKILQPKDRHILLTDQFTTSSPGFESYSEHLYNEKQLLERDADISEIFSRGQSPQHWHVARRGLGVNNAGKAIDGEVYMEVSRKETSLTDVDNVLSAVVRRFIG